MRSCTSFQHKIFTELGIVPPIPSLRIPDVQAVFKMILLQVTAVILFMANSAQCLEIKGQVVDSVTGNPIADVNVTIVKYSNIAPLSAIESSGLKIGSSTDLAGRFTIDVGAMPGVYTLSVTHVGYTETETEFVAGGEAAVVRLEPAAIQRSEVIVSTGRGVIGKTAGALTNIDRDLVDLSYGAQDIPLLAAQIPSAVAWTYTGSSVGASEMRIRGFDMNRMSVTANGIPMNDPEDHGTYWMNTPDFLSNTHDIQIERGVSHFSSGPAAVAGGLNLATSDAISNRELTLSLLSGSFNTTRRTLAYRSGIIEGTYNFTGRYSRVESDGYRDHTGVDMWSYFLAATRFDPNMITRLQIYGGQQEQDTYWYGVGKNDIWSLPRSNYSAWYKEYYEGYRWYDPVNWDGEREFFEQPHYVLHNQWRADPSVEITQSLFWIQGNGYYEQYKPNRKFSEYNLTPFEVTQDNDGDGIVDTVITISRTDLIHKKDLDKDQIGWLPRAKWKIDDATELGLGLELRSYTGKHWGNVMWARELPAGVDPQHEWYRWEGNKDYTGGFADIEHKFDDRLKMNAGLQVRSISYSVKQVKMGAFPGYEYDLDWLLINPRVGVTYEVSDMTSVYASIAGASREPMDDMIFDADGPDDIPKVEKYRSEFAARGLEYREIDPERMWDLEVGGRHSVGSVEVGANLYAMFFTDEQVAVGFSADRDQEIWDNVPTSRHIGIELDANWKDAVPGLSLSGNLGFGQAIIGDYDIFHVGWDDKNNPIVDTVNVKGNRMAGFPDITSNLRATFTQGHLTVSLLLTHVGKQYLDFREDNEAALDPYTVLDGSVQLKLFNILKGGGIDLELRGYNLLDLIYEPFGVVDVEDGNAYYIPAARQNWLVGVKFTL